MMEPMRYLNFIFVLVNMAMFAAPLSACPSCKGSLHENGVATGYAISILFMMAMPFVIMSFWIVTIIRLRSNAFEK